MQINTLKIKYPKKQRKTIGRGGKKGTYSGKGGKGQKGRSGVSINPLFEGGRSSLIDRLKKVRGFKSQKIKAAVFNLSALEKKFKENDIIDKESLAKLGFLNNKEMTRKIKILGGSAAGKKFKMGKEIMLSASVKKMDQKGESKEHLKAGKK
jgi:large subunit ribosomal protein L15